MRKPLLLIVFLVCAWATRAQTYQADTWEKVFKNKRGTVTALWDNIEPFIYLDGSGSMKGVEYELMESLKPYLKRKYGIDLTINWVNAGSFDRIYHDIKSTKQSGLFGWSYFSITADRKREVQFSSPYMPDLNVLVTNSVEPMYATSQEFTTRISDKHAYTMANTTMEEDVTSLKKNFNPSLAVTRKDNDYDVMEAISGDPNGFGYLPLSIYIVGLQKGIRVKRQNIISSRREGFAAILPLNSDWKPVMDEYLSTGMFHAKATEVVSKYLGSDVKDLVAGTTNTNPSQNTIHDLDIVSLEKEIVTKRLMDTAVEVQQQRSQRNLFIVILVFTLLTGVMLYRRNRFRKKLNDQLAEQNKQIRLQNEQIESMNKLLKMKVLQTRMNPHFLFNSLNSIQFLVTGNDKKLSLQYISRFSAFLRKVISFGDEMSITVANEADLLKDYLWLEQCRFSGRFEYEVTVQEGSSALHVLPLVTHSLVEDALYNSVLNLADDQKGKLTVTFAPSDHEVTIEITDNGRCKKSQIDGSEPVILNNGKTMLLHRMELYNNQGGKKMSLMEVRASGEEKLSCSTITIPQPVFNQTF